MIARTNSFLLARRIKKRRKSAAYDSVTQAGGYLLRQRLEFRHLSISLSFYLLSANMLTHTHTLNKRQ